MTQQRITVHFSQSIIKRIGTLDLQEWGDVMRAWHHDGDTDRVFGRDAPNSRNGTATSARHLHMFPSKDEDAWFKQPRPFDRTSDRLIIYSMDASAPLQYGIYLLDLLGDPGGHKKAFTGPTAQEKRELWEEIAWNHQNGLFSPAHST